VTRRHSQAGRELSGPRSASWRRWARSSARKAARGAGRSCIKRAATSVSLTRSSASTLGTNLTCHVGFEAFTICAKHAAYRVIDNTFISTTRSSYFEQSRHMRSQRQRRYLPRPVFGLLRPLLRYSITRDAYVLRIIGRRLGPVTRIDRRRRTPPFDGLDRRHARQLSRRQPG
jgi:hypothetical protein